MLLKKSKDIWMLKKKHEKNSLDTELLIYRSADRHPSLCALCILLVILLKKAKDTKVLSKKG